MSLRLYSLLIALLLRSPRPAWRTPAAILASLYLLTDRSVDHLCRDVLLACGQRPTWKRRRALAWARCMQRATRVLLTMQEARVTDAWASGHVWIEGELPRHGAILLTMHHRSMRLGLLALGDKRRQLANIADDNVAAAMRALVVDSAGAYYRSQWLHLSNKVFGGGVFGQREAPRKGLNLLHAGGYLVIQADVILPPIAGRSEGENILLGRLLSVPRGAVWFAEHSGKPMVPFLVLRERGGWRLWIGEPIEPSQEAVMRTLEGLICRAPEAWERSEALDWLAAPRVP